MHWSKGKPTLYQESKENLFAYLARPAQIAAESRAQSLCKKFHLEPLESLSTAVQYRKNLYLIETLNSATDGLEILTDGKTDLVEGLNGIGKGQEEIKALDVGSQDWHYVFGLERWLRFSQSPQGRKVTLKGVEIDGYGIYANFHSRKDYGEANAAQTDNPEVKYRVIDFLKLRETGFDFISIFYPFVLRYQLLLWGLPLHFFAPKKIWGQAIECLKPGGHLLVYCHTQREQDHFLDLGFQNKQVRLIRQGPVVSDFVHFYQDVTERKFSIWKRIS